VSEIQIKKRNGEFEKFDAEKINRVIQWACEDIKDVNASDVAMNAKFSIENKTSSGAIQEILIRSANDMISLDTPNYQYVAGRLRIYALRKEVWGTNEPPRLYDHLRKNRSLYDESLLASYSESEIHKIGKMVKHDRDFSFTYAGIQQMCDKYLIKDRSTGEIYETPQFAFVLVPMVLFKNYPNRLDMIKKTYDYISQFKINLPTPILAGVRTKLKNYSSCVLISIDDTLNSIFSSCHIVGQYVADRSGIGLDMGSIRAANSPIRNGEVRHTGIRPFAKLLESAVNSTSQGGIRKGSATVNFPFFHPEIQEILTYKNNKGADEKKVRFMDYCIQISGLLYDRLQKKKNITLMSYHEHPEVYKAFGLPHFDEVYEAAEKKGGKFSKVISAAELMDQMSKERLETGRIYVMHIDHANSHGTFEERVSTSNLCQEITHPIIPVQSLDDPNGLIGICVLSAVNLLTTKDEEFEDVCYIICRILHEVIDQQEYRFPAAERFCKGYRSIGVGVSNYAAYLASKKIKMNEEAAVQETADIFERLSYYMISASCKIAEETGNTFPYYDKTKWSKGILPCDTAVPLSFLSDKAKFDWEALRARIMKHGMVNGTVLAQMPVESSSVPHNSTNGIDNIREFLTTKKSGSGNIKMLPPNWPKNKSYYVTAFGMVDQLQHLRLYAAMQRYICMSISANLYMDYANYPDGKIPRSEIVKQMMYAHKVGVKNLYYLVTPDGSDDQTMEENGCSGGACAI
jgi:ribonucleoside-diphosphate reductase alpha chain